MSRRAEPYLDAGRTLLEESGCTLREVSKGTYGRAYTRAPDWGIVAPLPTGPVSFGVFAHEVGHQLLHRGPKRPRWLEEIEAWEYALAQFERFGLAGVERARERARSSLLYAAAKALRRCSPETATRILDRYSWVWTDREAVDRLRRLYREENHAD